ncbi:MAG TPA: ABC transporter ATP-binding protein, partial [Desulfobacteraceae bacterium]|nr:ABC transporter ATP-binding protein [Desulfobacteraceae bacterium]
AGLAKAEQEVDKKKNMFLDMIDELFKSTQKKIDREKNEISFIQREKDIISPYQLSSGEKQILVILLSALIQDNKHSVMIMDEPEISLHTDWQESLIDNIRKLNENAQIIIATHSPSIIINGWQDKVFEMSDIQVKK